jgi:hypothetical protein
MATICDAQRRQGIAILPRASSPSHEMRASHARCHLVVPFQPKRHPPSIVHHQRNTGPRKPSERAN